MRPVTFVVGAVVEAWGEFRTHKARVLMSLIGVAVAVLAITAVAAVSAAAQQSVTESLERQSGRPALLAINTPYQVEEGPVFGPSPTYPGDFGADVAREADRYGIDYWTRTAYVPMSVALPDGVQSMNLVAVDADWGTIHRVELAQGEWFRDSDADRLAPAMVIDTETWKTLGSPDLATHPTVRITQPSPATAVVIGVTPGGYPNSPTGMMLYDAYSGIAAGSGGIDPLYSSISYEAWVPPSDSDALARRLGSDLKAIAGEGWQVDVNRQDYLAQNGPDPLLILKVVAGAAAGFILLLGILGLVNISLVTVRTRVREIGIRRSFGATAARVFVGVMFESVVATTAAGFVGVILAILALKNPFVDGLLTGAGVQDIPPFPLSAALFGLLLSAGVGALAGLLPAIVAVRVKPIDAIRY